MSYCLDQRVIHCRNGVSTIVGTTKMGDRDYFIIHALRGDKENIYVPVIGAENIIRPVMDADVADKLLKELKKIELEFNTNTKQRRDAYKKRLSSGKVEDIAYLFRQYCLYNEFPDRVKLGPTDIEMLSYASNIFLDELSLTYNVERDKIEEIVKKKIAN